MDAGFVGWRFGAEQLIEVRGEHADYLVKILVAIAFERGVVCAFDESPENDVCLRIDQKGAELARRVGAGTVYPASQAELVVEFKDEVRGGGISHELIPSETVESGVQVVVSAQAVRVVLVAGIAQEKLVGCCESGRERSL